MLEPEREAFRCGNALTDGDARRNPDGSIDYGYYRRRASRLRRAKLHEAARRAARHVAPPIAIATAVAMMFAMSTRSPPMLPLDTCLTNAGSTELSPTGR